MPLTILNIDYYAKGELKNLLLHKSVVRNDANKIIGCCWQAVELDEKITNEIMTPLLQTDPAHRGSRKSLKIAKRYYLNSYYPSLDLTTRESECLFYLLRGKSMRDIANILCLSARTVESYIECIKLKMNCENKSMIIEKSILLGYTEIVPQRIINL